MTIELFKNIYRVLLKQETLSNVKHFNMHLGKGTSINDVPCLGR